MKSKAFPILVHLFFACTLPLCISATPKSDGTTDDGTHWTQAQKGCRLGVTMPPSCECGAALDVDIYLRNVDGKAAKLLEDIRSDDTFVKIEVVQSDGKSVRKTTNEPPGALVAEMQQFTIEPGKQLHSRLRLNGIYDLRSQGDYSMNFSCDLYCPDGKVSFALDKVTFRMTAPNTLTPVIEPIDSKGAGKAGRD